MTNAIDLHQFRVQTPSFLISDGCGEMTNLQYQQVLVEQLAREASIERINVSEAIQDLMKWIAEREHEDYIMAGFPPHKSNPFREKSSCNLI